MRPQATFSFFILFTPFSFFHSPHRSFLHVAPFSAFVLPPSSSFLLVHPSSSSILPPRPSFFLVPPSSSSLLPPRPALSKSFRIRKSPFFIDFDESINDQPTNQPTNGPTDEASYRDADASKTKKITLRFSEPMTVLNTFLSRKREKDFTSPSLGPRVNLCENSCHN